MSKIIGMYPKDIHVLLEFSSGQIKNILDFLGRCEIKYDGVEEPDMKEASEYVTGSFFQTLTDVEKHMKEMRDGT